MAKTRRHLCRGIEDLALAAFVIWWATRIDSHTYVLLLGIAGGLNIATGADHLIGREARRG